MKKKENKRTLLLAPLIAFLVLGTDFIVKTYLWSNFAHQQFSLIEGFLSINVILNTGVAFGFLQGKTNFLIYFTLILILFFLYIFKTEKNKTFTFRVSTGLILGGALSNLLDRLVLEGVIDYIDLGFWPVFNLSDACITVGAFLLILYSFKKQRERGSKLEP